MLQGFLDDVLTMDVREKLKDFINSFDRDHSGWVYVDGEEGDYGEILYSKDGVLVAKGRSEGGDCDWYEFTPEGKALLFSKLIEVAGASLQRPEVPDDSTPVAVNSNSERPRG